MNEYVLFNSVILAGPLFLSFDKRVNFRQHWGIWVSAMWLPVLVFLLWDSLVTHRHWWFNDEYAGTARILELPLGEWLFFFTVPYACLFSWEVLQTYFSDKQVLSRFPSVGVGAVLFALSFWVFNSGLEYTGLVLAVLSVVFLTDYFYKSNLFIWRNTWLYCSLILVFTLVFNGYLTARPVVLYDYAYQLKWLVYTIPIEDFLYGLSLLLWITIRYESRRYRVR
ncbi:lycopene cyclase domain-containing protein [bacterium]|nr:MAG: lycopene cyclase domain-containing protein [bacterium]